MVIAVSLVLHRYASDQPFMELAIGREQGRNTEIGDLLERVFAGGAGNVWIQSIDGAEEAFEQKDLSVVAAFRSSTFWRDVQSIPRRVSGRRQTNIDQMRTLATIRDTLLPRLISGQLRLPEAEAVLEPA
jgi:hypothetical protein